MVKQVHKVNPELHGFLVPVAELHEDEANPVTHDERNLDAIRRSLEAYGQQKPVVHREGTVIAGNGLLRTARGLGWTHVAAVESDLDDDAARAGYKIADNKTSDLHEWNWDATKGLLKELDEGGFDLVGTGFDEKELLKLGIGDAGELDEGPEPQIDRAAELQAEWGTELGQLWEIPGKAGVHRLLCGDATKREDVGRVMGGKLGQCVVTDPPYGVAYEGGQHNVKKRSQLEGDQTTDLYPPACQMAFRFTDDAAPLYLWHAGVKGIAAAAAAAGYEIRNELIWHKTKAHYGAFAAQYMQKHEPLYYCFKRGKTARWHGPTNEITVWECDQPSRNENHPTEKPVELAARPIRNSSERGQIVCDWFLGSGTTMVAAEQLGRICYGIEIEPKYVAVALQRMKDMGLEPSRQKAVGRKQ